MQRRQFMPRYKEITSLARPRLTQVKERASVSSEDTPPTVAPEILQAYRKDLIIGRQKAVEELDKAVITLGSGAIAASFAIVKAFVDSKTLQADGYLLAAWISWGAGVIFTAFSFLISYLAHTRTIKLIDSDRLYAPGVNPEGGWNRMCFPFKFAGLTCYAIGIALFIIFIHINTQTANAISTSQTKSESKPAPTTSTPTNTSTADEEWPDTTASTAPNPTTFTSEKREVKASGPIPPPPALPSKDTNRSKR